MQNFPDTFSSLPWRRVWLHFWRDSIMSGRRKSLLMRRHSRSGWSIIWFELYAVWPKRSGIPALVRIRTKVPNTRFCRESDNVTTTCFFGLVWTQILLRQARFDSDFTQISEQKNGLSSPCYWYDRELNYFMVFLIMTKMHRVDKNTKLLRCEVTTTIKNSDLHEQEFQQFAKTKEINNGDPVMHAFWAMYSPLALRSILKCTCDKFLW